MSNMNFLCNLSTVIPRPPCLFSMAKAISLPVKVVNSQTSDSVYSFSFVMCTFGSKRFSIELVPCSDSWLRTWWETIHRMLGMSISSIPQCKKYCHDCPYQELLQAVRCFEPTFMEVRKALKLMCYVRSLKLRIMRTSWLEDIITCNNVVFEDLESDVVLRIWKLSNSTWETFKRYVIKKFSTASEILTLEIQVSGK